MNQNTPPALRRRIPKVKDLAPLMQFKKVDFSATARLKRASTIADLRTIAKRRTPQAPFDYTDGAAEAEITLNRARQAFTDLEFRPGILRNVESVDLSTDVLGRTAAMPFGIAPTGFTRMMHSEGEYAGSRAAEAAGIPFTISTMGTASHRGRGCRSTVGAQLVPALSLDRPGPVHGADRARLESG